MDRESLDRAAPTGAVDLVRQLHARFGAFSLAIPAAAAGPRRFELVEHLADDDRAALRLAMLAAVIEDLGRERVARQLATLE